MTDATDEKILAAIREGKGRRRFIGLLAATKIPAADLYKRLHRLKAEGRVRYLMCAGWEIKYG